MDEAYFGGLEKNKSNKRKRNAGWGTSGKSAAVCIKDRNTRHITASKVPPTDKNALQGFITDKVGNKVKIYSDDNRAYQGLNREVVRHSLGGIRAGAGTHQLDGIFLVHAQAGVLRDVSPHE